MALEQVEPSEFDAWLKNELEELSGQRRIALHEMTDTLLRTAVDEVAERFEQAREADSSEPNGWVWFWRN